MGWGEGPTEHVARLRFQRLVAASLYSCPGFGAAAGEMATQNSARSALPSEETCSGPPPGVEGLEATDGGVRGGVWG